MVHLVSVTPIDRCPMCGMDYDKMPPDDGLTNDPDAVTCTTED